MTLSGQHTKNSDDATLPLRPATTEKLRAFFAGKLPQAQAFKMPYTTNVARMLRRDLDGAGVEIDPDRGNVDFHGLPILCRTWTPNPRAKNRKQPGPMASQLTRFLLYRSLYRNMALYLDFPGRIWTRRRVRGQPAKHLFRGTKRRFQAKKRE